MFRIKRDHTHTSNSCVAKKEKLGTALIHGRDTIANAERGDNDGILVLLDTDVDFEISAFA